jgi:hypothetical protein
VRRSQKNGPILFFIHNDFYPWKYDRIFPRVKNILNKENYTTKLSLKRGVKSKDKTLKVIESS